MNTDKGIFYLLCSVLILAVVVLMGLVVNKHVSQVCQGQVVTHTQTVMVTPSATPTATPAATFKRAVVVTPVVKK